MLESLEADRHRHENHSHGSGGEHEHPSSAESGHREGDDDSVDERPALVGDVDPGLCICGSVPHQAEQKTLVVRQQCVAAHLSEESEKCGDEYSATHTRGTHHIQPRLLGVLHLKFDGRSDLRHLGLYEDGIGITFGMILDQNSEGFVIAVFADQETGALWQETRDLLTTVCLAVFVSPTKQWRSAI